eukprot:c11678_g1_i3.p1 GENE.c11678_g1_i3~~c11678_g1_i3.p1  ORF type:complete len:164 (-),score=39.92 c11678_g1_i3:284-775(-)
MSVCLGIPGIIVLYYGIPRNASYGWAFAFNLLAQGFVCTWCSAACNRPILSEIVEPRSRGSVFALLVALEGSSGAMGAPLVGILSEHVFGYKQSKLAVADMDDATRQANMSALATAMVCVMVIPWTLCFLLYGLMHAAYPSERLLKVQSRTVTAPTRSAVKAE